MPGKQFHQKFYKLFLLYRGNHPYIKAVKDVGKTFITRLRNPFMMIDWIFRRTKGGKIFYNGLDVVHSLAEKVQLTLF